MRTIQMSALQPRERRWVKSLVLLFVVAGLVVVDVPAYAAKATSKSTILGKTGDGPWDGTIQFCLKTACAELLTGT